MIRSFTISAVLALAGGATAAEPWTADRTVGREPTYKSKAPKYLMVAFGPEGKDRVWFVQDNDVLFADRNGNGDLTDPGEAVPAKKPREGVTPDEGEFTFEVGSLTVGGRTHKGFTVFVAPLAAFASESPEAKTVLAQDPKATVVQVRGDVDVTGLKGGGIEGRVSFEAGFTDAGGALRFAEKRAEAPVVRFGGPLEVTFYGRLPAMRTGRSGEFVLVVGTPGAGPGTFAMVQHTDTAPEGAHPVAEVVFPPPKAGTTPTRTRYELKERCCGVNFYGPVQAADTAGSGPATVTISFDNWKGAKVAPTTHQVQVLPPRAAKTEPVSPALAATLVHPDRKAVLGSITFSADGARLFAAGYPSGVVQVFDVAGRKELRRIETPSGLRGTDRYALLTPDWKTLYVPTETQRVKSAEVDGKSVTQVEFTGVVRVWDMTTGDELAPLRPPEGSGAMFARLSPDGKTLVCSERPNFNVDSGKRPSNVTAVWDLATRTRRKLGDGFQVPVFNPRDRAMIVQQTDAVRVLDAATFREQAELKYPDKDRRFFPICVAPDGTIVAISVGGKKGAPHEVWFRDAKTLEDRGKFVAEGDAERYGWTSGEFSPDGKHCVLALSNRAVVWDVKSQKVARTVTFETANHTGSDAVFSPDGRLAAVSWIPKFEVNGRNRDPDPQDYPQPRVAVFETTGDAAPRTFIAPHGFLGGLAFSPDGKTLAFGSCGGVHLFDLTK